MPFPILLQGSVLPDKLEEVAGWLGGIDWASLLKLLFPLQDKPVDCCFTKELDCLLKCIPDALKLYASMHIYMFFKQYLVGHGYVAGKI